MLPCEITYLPHGLFNFIFRGQATCDHADKSHLYEVDMY
jgi:hypothetical protein